MIHETIQLHTSKIFLGHNCIDEVLRSLSLGEYSASFIISQQRIWDFHGDKVAAALDLLTPKPQLRLIPDGESTKSLETFTQLQSWLADCGADRKSLIVVLGGGVVGDLSGFVAAAYMRGIDWLYIPTTLLAQQDASVGGKVAVNLPQGKNLVGHFWEPRAVIIDSATLETLPDREMNAGYMEFLKHALLDGEALYADVAALPPGQLDFRKQMDLLARGLKVKLGVVSRDPLEKGERRLLNLGHTFGHAIESYTGYSQFLHGEAVGLGMIYACFLARRLGSDYDYHRLIKAVRRRVPAFEIAHWDTDRILALTQLDKKGVKGIVSWIVPFAPGKVEIIAGIDDTHLKGARDDFVKEMS